MVEVLTSRAVDWFQYKSLTNPVAVHVEALRTNTPLGCVVVDCIERARATFPPERKPVAAELALTLLVFGTARSTHALSSRYDLIRPATVAVSVGVDQLIRPALTDTSGTPEFLSRGTLTSSMSVGH